MMPRTMRSSSARSTPATPRHTASGRIARFTERLLDHRVEHFLDFELAVRLQVRASARPSPTIRAVAVGEIADGLRASGVDAEDVHAFSLPRSAFVAGALRCRVQLTWADYLVIGGYLAAITAFGSWFARFQKTTRDYFLTDRSVPWWAVCFTVVATETSTLTFIGIPASAYAGNMTFLQLALGYVIGRIIVSLLFIPAYFRGDLFTSYELLQQRFGSASRRSPR